MTTAANRIHQAFGVSFLALLMVCVIALAQSASDRSDSFTVDTLHPRSSVQADPQPQALGPDTMASIADRREAASQSL